MEEGATEVTTHPQPTTSIGLEPEPIGLMPVLWTTICALVTYGIPLIYGATLPSAGIVVITFCVTALFTIITVLLDFRWFLLYWLSLLLLQNAAAGFWYVEYVQQVPFIVTEAKTIALAVGSLCLARDMIHFSRSNAIFLLGAALYTAGLLTNITGFGMSALANLRNFITPVIILLLAISIAARYSEEIRKNLLTVVASVTAFWLFTGALGELLIGTQKWREAFSAEALGGLNSLSERTVLLGFTLQRSGGFLLEPINAGYVGASVLIVFVIYRYYLGIRDYTLGWSLIVGASLFAVLVSAAKNAILMLVLVVGITVLSKLVKLSTKVIIVLPVALSFVFTMLYISFVKGLSYAVNVWSDPFGLSGGESASIHMAGLILGFQSWSSNLFGAGVGAGGNFYRILNPEITREQWIGTGGESAWGTLAYQGGLFAVVGLMLILWSIAYRLGSAGAALVSVWAGAALFAESFFGPIACSVLLMSAGFLLSSPTGLKDPGHVASRSAHHA